MTRKKLEDTGFYRQVFSPVFKGSLIFIMVLFVIGGLVFYIWYHNYIIKLANEVHVLRKELTELKIERDRQMTVIIRKESYPKILKFATERLGLIPAPEKPLEFEVPGDKYREYRERRAR
jgi:hypothetical protein